MSLHLTRDEADRLTVDGSGVLFRAGDLEAGCLARWPEAASGEYHPNCCRFPKSCSVRKVPPAKFVEAAQRCPAYLAHSVLDRAGGCPGCLDGKRRVAAVVPMLVESTVPTADVWRNVTVGHVVVMWGPLVVVEKPPPSRSHIGSSDKSVFVHGGDLWFSSMQPHTTSPFITSLPPDIDPQSLVGQYAIGVEVAP